MQVLLFPREAMQELERKITITDRRGFVSWLLREMSTVKALGPSDQKSKYSKVAEKLKWEHYCGVLKKYWKGCTSKTGQEECLWWMREGCPSWATPGDFLQGPEQLWQTDTNPAAPWGVCAQPERLTRDTGGLCLLSWLKSGFPKAPQGRTPTTVWQPRDLSLISAWTEQTSPALDTIPLFFPSLLLLTNTENLKC